MGIQNQWSKTIAVVILTMASISSRAQVNVTTWHNDLARTGVVDAKALRDRVLLEAGLPP